MRKEGFISIFYIMFSLVDIKIERHICTVSINFLALSLVSLLQLNGSLRKWEKTHTMKIYSDELNGRRTSVSFAYYPQFWLSENKRPVFVKALYQLIARY